MIENFENIHWQLPPARPKELLRKEKGWLTGVGHNSWLHMKCAQDAAHKSEYKKWDYLNIPGCGTKIKGPTHVVEGDLPPYEKCPNPHPCVLYKQKDSKVITECRNVAHATVSRLNPQSTSSSTCTEGPPFINAQLHKCWNTIKTSYDNNNYAHVNPLCTKFFRGNMNTYLHFVSFLHIDTAKVVEILSHIRQEPTYST